MAMEQLRSEDNMAYFQQMNQPFGLQGLDQNEIIKPLMDILTGVHYGLGNNGQTQLMRGGQYAGFSPQDTARKLKAAGYYWDGTKWIAPQPKSFTNTPPVQADLPPNAIGMAGMPPPVLAHGTNGSLMDTIKQLMDMERYGKMTGDAHIPALIGTEEGVVNKEAMRHGGDRIVAQLNNMFPNTDAPAPRGAIPQFADGTPLATPSQAISPQEQWLRAMIAAHLQAHPEEADPRAAAEAQYGQSPVAPVPPQTAFQGIGQSPDLSLMGRPDAVSGAAPNPPTGPTSPSGQAMPLSPDAIHAMFDIPGAPSTPKPTPRPTPKPGVGRAIDIAGGMPPVPASSGSSNAPQRSAVWDQPLTSPDIDLSKIDTRDPLKAYADIYNATMNMDPRFSGEALKNIEPMLSGALGMQRADQQTAYQNAMLGINAQKAGTEEERAKAMDRYYRARAQQAEGSGANGAGGSKDRALAQYNTVTTMLKNKANQYLAQGKVYANAKGGNNPVLAAKNNVLAALYTDPSLATVPADTLLKDFKTRRVFGGGVKDADLLSMIQQAQLTVQTDPLMQFYSHYQDSLSNSINQNSGGSGAPGSSYDALKAKMGG